MGERQVQDLCRCRICVEDRCRICVEERQAWGARDNRDKIAMVKDEHQRSHNSLPCDLKGPKIHFGGGHDLGRIGVS